MKKIIPSIIAKSQKELDERINKVNFSNTFHLDVMDGKFVKNKSLMFSIKLPKTKKYQAHLMMNGHSAMNWIRKNKKKVDLIIIHYEAQNFKPLLGHLRKQKIKVGIAINPKTPVKSILPYINNIDLILIMTVNPGKYGAKFLPSPLKKIKQLKKINPKIKIGVDGSINPKTISKASKSGADVFTVGSFLQKSDNTQKAIKELKSKL